MQKIIGDYSAFIANINSGLEKCGISNNELAMCDHICYRVETEARYQEMVVTIGKLAQKIDETIVSGRLITTFEFDEPLQVAGWSISCLELPQPKPGSPYTEGLEHAEFVTITSLAKFRACHSDLPFNDKGMDKTINPELGLKHAGISVKFHEQPLGAVVRIEQRLKLNN